MKIISVMQSSNNQNQTNFEGTVQVLIKKNQPNAAAVREIFSSTLSLNGPTAIQNILTENGVYEIKASFTGNKHFRVSDTLVILTKKYGKNCKISFNYVNKHGLTLEELEKFEFPSLIFDDGVLKDGEGALKDGEGALKDGEGALKDGEGALKDGAKKGLVSRCISALIRYGVEVKTFAATKYKRVH